MHVAQILRLHIPRNLDIAILPNHTLHERDESGAVRVGPGLEVLGVQSYS
jgi:hypothetical protein